MADYRILLTRSAEREILELPGTIQERVERAIDLLRVTPRPSGSRKLRGSSGLWRIRVGDYRVVYMVDDRTRTIDVSHVRHRKDVYR